MKNFEDNRICVRLDPDIKKWFSDQGGSKVIREVLIAYYEKENKTKYLGTGK